MNAFVTDQNVTFTDGTVKHTGVVLSATGNQVLVGKISPPINNSPTVTKSAEELTPAQPPADV